MTSNSPTAIRDLTAQEAVALTLLRDGYTQRTIYTRTGVTGEDLFPLAAVHGITAPHGTADGARCHEAADEEPCADCDTALVHADARARARQRRTLTPEARARLLRSRRPTARQ
ncbi:hypothetical protein ACIBL6_47590 [Streptomyces sp. NPDC050400]|uniref:hypothetical protein n=1 Tax=Streptomyces sp. NPDC050400 TaxID=3365610 RepID=UPI00379ED1E3